MAEEETRVIQYDDNNFHALMEEFKSLSTFQAMASWDQRAQAEVDRIIGVIRELDAEIARQSEALEQAKSEHAQKSFLKRTFSGRKSEKDIAQFIEECRQHKTTLEEMGPKCKRPSTLISALPVYAIQFFRVQEITLPLGKASASICGI